jgi:hypothetical protein
MPLYEAKMTLYHVHRWKGRLEVELEGRSRRHVSNCWHCSPNPSRQQAVARLLQGERAGCFLCQNCKDKLFW